MLDGVLCTPTTDACPEGITRATVLRLAADAGIRTEVGDFPLARLYSAEEAFVTGTMGELTPVLVVDGRRIGAGEAGPLTEQLSAAYAGLTAVSGSGSSQRLRIQPRRLRTTYSATRTPQLSKATPSSGHQRDIGPLIPTRPPGAPACGTPARARTDRAPPDVGA